MADKRKRSSTKLARAIGFVTDGIDAGLFDAEQRLPPVTQLAAQAGVSFVTMWKALARLRSDGVLSGKKRQRFRLALTPVREQASLTQANRPPHAWEKLTSSIEKEILNGVHPQGQYLPTAKELRRVHGASPSTVRKALAALHRTGLVTPAGRSYRVATAGADRAGSRIMLMIHSDKPGWMPLGELDLEYLRTMEAECSLARIRLEPVTYRLHEGRIAASMAGTAAPVRSLEGDDVLGYFVLMPHGEVAAVKRLLATLTRYARPVALLDATGALRVPGALPAYPLVQAFSLALSEKPGLDMGRYLLRTGHGPLPAGAWPPARGLHIAVPPPVVVCAAV
jgi:DNA-binding FadR family transcriptional regulator